MGEILNANERRVLGVLIEKSMSQPEYYPMTINAVVTGCNQKSNRNPCMELDEEDVQGVLDDLRGRGLVGLVLPAPGARMQRFKHLADTRYGWNARQRAIMSELLLRGPQTPGELRSRTARMFQFESLEAVMTALGSLTGDDAEITPVVAAMPREPGQSAIRYTHLLYPPHETPATAPAAPPPRPATAPTSPAATSPHTTDSRTAPTPASTAGGDIAALRSEMEALHEEVADLHEELSDLRKRVETLENRM